MRHAMYVASRGLAYTLKCFVLNCVTRISDEYIEAVGTDQAQRTFLEEQQALCLGASIISPVGTVLAQGDGDDSELLVAEIDLEQVIKPKLMHDFAGHYNRPELFAPLFQSDD